MRLGRSFMMVICVMFASSCAHMFKSHARVVKSMPGKGGEIAINQGFDGGVNARTEAESFMASTCSGMQYQITEEGETVTGQVSDTRSDQSASSNFRSISGSSSTTTKNTTEWRLKYECRTTTAQS